MLKIITIVGARPQFVKLAPLSKALRFYFHEVIVHTGQHYNLNMSDSFFNDLNIPAADFNLGVGSGGHGKQTASMINGISDVIQKEAPACVIVFGDTNSTLAGAIAASKSDIPLVHIESGLRSFNRKMPEEINRIATDHVSDYLFAPTQTAMTNLKQEGLGDRAYLTGDIMVNTIKNCLDKAKNREHILSNYGVKPNAYYLLTLHRPYNVDQKESLVKILSKLANLEKKVVFPVHPRTNTMIEKNDINVAENIIIIEPVGYIDFLCLQYYSSKIITDSGGIQKEAYILGKPCITLRSETEWLETVDSGWNLLLNPKTKDLAEIIISFSPHTEQPNIFGRNVAEKMVKLICQKLH